ncbi:MAG: FHA domain-containing protein, partial [Planctomycetales bacterium]|nr:FHA domain-containing protein [Planctomycetales bacterium]
MALLRLEKGTSPGREYPVGDSPLVLGRATTCTVEVDDKRASRNHARVVKSGPGWAVEDLQSRNGTFVNGAKVARTDLKDGDAISIGTTVFRFVAAGQANVAVPAPAPPKGAGRPAAAKGKTVVAASAKARPAPKGELGGDVTQEAGDLPAWTGRARDYVPETKRGEGEATPPAPSPTPARAPTPAPPAPSPAL